MFRRLEDNDLVKERFVRGSMLHCNPVTLAVKEPSYLVTILRKMMMTITILFLWSLCPIEDTVWQLPILFCCKDYMTQRCKMSRVWRIYLCQKFEKFGGTSWENSFESSSVWSTKRLCLREITPPLLQILDARRLHEECVPALAFLNLGSTNMLSQRFSA